MTRNFCIAALPFVLLLGGCCGTPVAPGVPVTRSDDGAVRVILGPRTTAVIGSPTAAEAYKIVSPLSPTFEKMKRERPVVGEYPILERVPLPPAVAAEAATTLLNPRTYDPAFQTGCNFEPGYVLRFRKGGSTVDAAICFKCGDIEFSPSADLGETGTTQPFGKSGTALYDAVMKVFPAPRKPVA